MCERINYSRDSIQCTATSSYWSRYCCDPFKHHRRRIYSHLRVVPASLTVADTGGGGSGGRNPPPPPLRAKHEYYYITCTVYEYHIVPHVSYCQQFARDETINVNFGIFPQWRIQGGGGGGPGCMDPPPPRT